MKKEEILTELLEKTPGTEDKKIISFLKKPELKKVYSMYCQVMRAQRLSENITRVEILKSLVEDFPEERERIEALQAMTPEEWKQFIIQRKNTPGGIDTQVHGNNKLIARVMFYPESMTITARYLSMAERQELNYV